MNSFPNRTCKFPCIRLSILNSNLETEMNSIKFSDAIFEDYNKNDMNPNLFRSIMKDVTFTFPNNIKSSCWIYSNPNKIITVNKKGKYVTVREAIYEFFNGKLKDKLIPCKTSRSCINPIHNKVSYIKTPLSDNIVEKIIKDCLKGISKSEILITYNISEQQLYDIYIAKSFNSIWNERNLDYIKFIDTVNFEFDILENNIDFNKYIINDEDETSIDTTPISGNDYFKDIKILNSSTEEISTLEDKTEIKEEEKNDDSSSLIFIDRGKIKTNIIHEYPLEDNVGNGSVYEEPNKNNKENIEESEQDDYEEPQNKQYHTSASESEKTNPGEESVTKIKTRINKIYSSYCNLILPEYLKLIKSNQLSEEEYYDFEDIIYSILDKLKMTK